MNYHRRNIDISKNNQILEQSQPKKKKRKAVKIIIGTILVISFILITVAGQAVVSNNDDESLISRLPIIGSLSRLMGASTKKLDGALEGRTNFLILGIGGAGHEGPNLADTIMIISINNTENTISMISIPRDLLVPVQGLGMRKINSLNSIESRNKNNGANLTVQTIENILGIPIHYFIRIDFKAFEAIIDALDGIDIYVPQSFSDPFYPLGPNQYQTVSFTKGLNHFDGATALKYARSRYTTSDYDRAKRQQEIIKAVKNKSLKIKTWLNPSSMIKIWKSLNKHVTTNLEKNEIQTLIGLIPELNTKNITQVIFTDAPDNFLYATTTKNGAFALLPNIPDYSELKNVAVHIFEPNVQLKSNSSKYIQKPSLEKNPTVIIKNGTNTQGLAAQTANFLKKQGFTIKGIGNAVNQDYNKTIIYDLTYGEKLTKLAFLKSSLDADIANVIPDDIQVTYEGVTDFYIIIGRQ